MELNENLRNESRLDVYEVKTSNLVFSDDKDRILPIGNLKKMAEEFPGLKYILENDTVSIVKKDGKTLVLVNGKELDLPEKGFHIDEQLELF